jgi:ribonucleoside-diphosphate reductase alpha subunit
LSDELNVDVNKLVTKVFSQLKEVNTITEVEDLFISVCQDMMIEHPDYEKVSTKIMIDNLHSTTKRPFAEIVELMYNNKNEAGNNAPIVNDVYKKFCLDNCEELESYLDFSRDYRHTYFGIETLKHSYLKKIKNIIIESPQHLYLRVAISCHYKSNIPVETKLDKIKKTYNYLSKGYFTHATPTLFNSGSICEQLSSCFLLGIADDIDTIGDIVKKAMKISKHAGGISICLTHLRAIGSYISTTQGKASGIKLAKVLNEIARYADQGGKRPGSIAIYTEPWHADIIAFLELKKNTGAETERARDLFYGLMMNDIFMRRVEEDEIWSLMCPHTCPELLNKYGKDFDDAYIKYELEGKFVKQIKARDLWLKIMDTCLETGTPYIVFKDAANSKSNQQNIGVINSSNLCTEILEYSSATEFAVCNLASICLPMFVEENNGKYSFNHDELLEVTKHITYNLNNIIDINYYPVPETKISNMKNRPIGIGVQGLADVFAKMRMSFDSPEAKQLNKEIFETIYYGSLLQSNELSKLDGPYDNFKGSPLSKGLFQHNLWGHDDTITSGRWNFAELRENIIKYGVRNSETTTVMPTASTSQIQGNNECIEPFTKNIYVRATNAGDYYVVNKYLVAELMELGLWNSNMIDMIKHYESIQMIDEIPDNIKLRYRTVWEISKKSLIDMAADRGSYVSQSQSFNQWLAEPSYKTLTTTLFYAWKKGLKTGMYYCRTKPKTEAIKFGIDVNKTKELENKLNNSDDGNNTGPICRMEEGCIHCSS